MFSDDFSEEPTVVDRKIIVLTAPAEQEQIEWTPVPGQWDGLDDAELVAMLKSDDVRGYDRELGSF